MSGLTRLAVLDGDPDATGTAAGAHAHAVSAAIRYHCPHIELRHFPVFSGALRCKKTTVLEQLQAAICSDAKGLHCSFGFSSSDFATETLFRSAVQNFTWIVASAPARGAPVFPAAYADIISASGDARCTADQHSYLNTDSVDFAACPLPPQTIDPALAGASIAAARISGMIAAIMSRGAASREQMLKQLITGAAYTGAERKT